MISRRELFETEAPCTPVQATQLRRTGAIPDVVKCRDSAARLTAPEKRPLTCAAPPWHAI
jgi:hypothetical protein